MERLYHIKPAVQWHFKKQEEEALQRAVAEEEASCKRPTEECF